MANLCPFRQFVDADGAPLAGGLIYTYITRSSTPKTTYTDSEAGTSLSNPIVLDSAGCANIWMDTDTTYRLIIKDADGNQIGSTIDDVSPIVLLSASTGGSNIDITGFAIITTANGNINLTPNGTGHVQICGAYKLPSADGASTQALLANGSGQTYWGSVGGTLVQDPSPALGGNLNLNGMSIVDVNLNSEIKFTATTSAVNYLNIANAATAGTPVLSANGSDSNVNLGLTAKGTGLIVANNQLKATAGITSPGTFTVSDYTNTGTLASFIGVASEVNYPTFTASVTGSPVIFGAAGSDTNIGISITPKGSGPVKINTFVQPSTDGVVGTYVGTDGSKNLTLRNPITDLGANKATMEAASSTTTLVTPSAMLNHPGIPKVCVRFAGSASNGALTLGTGSYVATVARTSARVYVITFDTPFTDATYIFNGGLAWNTGTDQGWTAQTSLVLAGSITMGIGSGTDTDGIMTLTCWGTQ